MGLREGHWKGDSEGADRDAKWKLLQAKRRQYFNKQGVVSTIKYC